MRSASLFMSRPRSDAVIFDHGPESNALRAALTARSMSALSPSATWQIGSPVQGLMVGNVLPDTLSTHLPPMNIGSWALTRGILTEALAAGRVAVVIVGTPLCQMREGDRMRGLSHCREEGASG